jgi:hypothetical protein
MSSSQGGQQGAGVVRNVSLVSSTEGTCVAAIKYGHMHIETNYVLRISLLPSQMTNRFMQTQSICLNK